MPTTLRPTVAELAILNVLWDEGRLTVRAMQQILDRAKPTGYTTVLKLVQIMTAKGLVVRDESLRPQVYRAAHSRAQMQRRLVRDLVSRAFGGSVRALVLQALSTKKTSSTELRAIEALLDRYEQEAK